MLHSNEYMVLATLFADSRLSLESVIKVPKLEEPFSQQNIKLSRKTHFQSISVTMKNIVTKVKKVRITHIGVSGAHLVQAHVLFLL